MARSAGACPPRAPAGPVTVVRDRLIPNGAWRRTVLARSAGACPPRSFDLREKRTPAKAIPRSDQGMARDRPSPYGKRHAFFHRSAGACPPRSFPFLARSAGACPPRLFDLREKRTPARAVSLSIVAWRGTGPRPTVSDTFFPPRTPVCPIAWRGTGPRPTVSDTFFPRDRCLARETRSPARVASEGPRPTIIGTFFPPRTHAGQNYYRLSGICVGTASPKQKIYRPLEPM